MMPRTINDLFTARGTLLLQIQKAISSLANSSLSKQREFVITGLGGQGKSEIYLKVANQMREKQVYPQLCLYTLH